MASGSAPGTGASASLTVVGGQMAGAPSAGSQQVTVAANQQVVTMTKSSAEAWSRHLSKLKPFERDMFQKSTQGDLNAYLNRIIDAFEEQQRKSWSQKLTTLIEPLFVTIRLYMPAVSIAVQADPSPSALVLGGIACLMQVSSGYHQYQENLADMLSRMGRKANILVQFDQLIYQTDDQVQNALVEVYGDILDFCAEALRPLVDKKGGKRNRLKMFNDSLWQPFESKLGLFVKKFEDDLDDYKDKADLCTKRRDEDFRRRHDEFAKHAQNFQMQHQQTLMNVASMNQGIVADITQRHTEEEDFRTKSYDFARVLTMRQDQNQQSFKEIFSMNQGMMTNMNQRQMEEESRRDEESKARQDEKRRRIIKWISSTSFEKDFEEKYDSHLTGTGQWLLEFADYQSWKSCDKSSLLWIKGKDGCGKSVLASLAIHDLQDSAVSNSAVAFVFCSSLQQKKDNPLEILRSTLRQLVIQQKPKLDQALEKFYDQKGDLQTDGPNWQQTRKAIESVVSNFNETFLVFDGMDECQDSERLSKFLLSMSEMPLAPVKVLVLSRPGYLVLEDTFGRCPTILVDSGANDNDIRSFIENLLSGGRIAVKDDNALLDIKSVLLSKAEGMFLYISLMAKTLIGLSTPNQVQRKLKSLPKGLEKVYELALKRILRNPDEEKRQWAIDAILWAVNAKRRLSQAEILEAVVVKPGMRDLDDGDRFAVDMGLTSLCADLIELDRDGYYRLVHSSLKDYLQSLPDDLSSPLEFYRLKQKDADLLLAEICLTYLLFDKFRARQISTMRKLNRLMKENPLLGYASEYWGTHLTQETEVRLRGLVIELIDSPRLRELLLLSFHKYAPPTPRETHSLHILSFFNLTETAKSDPGALLLVDKVDSFGWDALDYANAQHSKEFCIWILRSTKTPALSLGRNLPPLHIAAVQDWVDVVDLLLSLGFDAGSKDGKTGWTPILHAVVCGSVSIVKRLLLEPCIDVNAPSTDGELLLTSCAMLGHLSVIRPLCEAGADPNACNIGGSTALHCASIMGNHEMVKLLLRLGARADAKDHEGRIPLHFAANGKLQSLKLLLMAQQDTIDWTCENGATPLHYAAMQGMTSEMKYLVEKGASVNAMDNSNMTPLNVAVFNGQREAVKLLLAEGAETRLAGPLIRPPLHCAAAGGHEKLISLFVTAKADPEAIYRNGITALHLSAEEGNVEFVKQLFATVPGLNSNPKSTDGQTPLHRAAMFGHLEIVQFLLQKQVTMTLDNKNQLPLHYAASNGHFEIVRELLTPEVVDIPGWASCTALIQAASTECLESIELLLNNGADINARNEFGETALLVSLLCRHTKVALLLIEKGADVRETNKSGHTALRMACRLGNTEIIQKLLDQGCDGAEISLHNHCPFFEAVAYGNLDAVDTLLDNGINGSTIIDDQGRSCVHVAAAKGNHSMLKKMLDSGADATNSDFLNRNALYFAACGGCIDIFHELLDMKLDFNGSPNGEYTPLRAGVEGGYVEIVDLLLSLKVEVNKSSRFTGRTALMSAVFCTNPRIFKQLLEAGADLFHRDAFGFNALDYASEIPLMAQMMRNSKLPFTPFDQATRELILLRTIRGCLRSNLALSRPLTPTGKGERFHQIVLLGRSLIYLADYKSYKMAKLCYMEAMFLSDLSIPKLGLMCDICGKGGHGSICTKCPNSSLCNDCHSAYLIGWKAPNSAPEEFRIIEQLEREVLKVRKAVARLLCHDPRIICHPFRHPVLKTWLEEKAEAYRSWEEKFNTDGCWEYYARPGEGFLNLIKETGEVLDSIEEQNPHEAEEEESKLDAIDKSFKSLFRDHKVSRMLPEFICSGHQYLKISKDDMEDLKNEGGIFDSDGRLSDIWLRDLLAYYEYDEEDQTVVHTDSLKSQSLVSASILQEGPKEQGTPLQSLSPAVSADNEVEIDPEAMKLDSITPENSPTSKLLSSGQIDAEASSSLSSSEGLTPSERVIASLQLALGIHADANELQGPSTDEKAGEEEKGVLLLAQAIKHDMQRGNAIPAVHLTMLELLELIAPGSSRINVPDFIRGYIAIFARPDSEEDEETEGEDQETEEEDDEE